MNKNEAYNFLYNLSWEIGTMAMEYLSDKDGEKIREAVNVLASGGEEDE